MQLPLGLLNIIKRIKITHHINFIAPLSILCYVNQTNTPCASIRLITVTFFLTSTLLIKGMSHVQHMTDDADTCYYVQLIYFFKFVYVCIVFMYFLLKKK